VVEVRMEYRARLVRLERKSSSRDKCGVCWTVGKLQAGLEDSHWWDRQAFGEQ